MGDSIFLARSFSQPADFSSHETNEVVPHRVLTESVSFGRFANETLSWEKWSAFTQNRYLEEVERFTKPGSVAEKRAFFEAHFKSRASGRVTHTKKIGEAKSKASDEVVCKVPLLVNNGTGVDEVSHGEVSTNEVDFAVPSVSIMDETTDVQTGEVEVTTNVENLNTMSVLEDKALDEDSISLSKERPSSSSGSKACSTSSKLEPSFVIGLDHPVKNTAKESSSSSERPVSVLKNRNILPPEPPGHMPLRCAPSGTTDKTIVGMSQGSSIAKSAVKADKKKTSGPNSIHMSLNFASSASQSTITAPKKMARNSTTQETNSSNAISSGTEPMGASKSRKRPFHRTSKEGSTAARCSTSASAARLPELPPPKKQLSENKRKNISVGSSVSCKIPKVQRQPSVGSENLSIHSRTKAKSFTVSSPFVFKSDERAERKKEVELEKMEGKRSENLSTHSRTKGKSFTVSSPFVFRSDERAERRKEFFQKLEEKNKKEDAVKEKLSCGLKANQNTHFPSEDHKKNPEVGCFQGPLINLTSPRFRRNKTSGTVQTPSKAFSPKIIKTRKAVTEKLKSCKIQPSSKSQTKINTQENVSPNIMQQ